MNRLQVFNFSGNNVRVVTKDGQPWWVAKDVSDALGYSETNAMTKRLDEEDFISDKLEGMNMKSILVNESGLYAAILGSHLPEAKQFKRWITHEVLPTIRKTGGYVANEDLFINTYLPHADDQTKLIFKATLETVRKANEQISIMQPKAEYFDALVDRNLLTNFRDTAKEIQVKERDFIGWLLERGYVYRDGKGKLKPYAQYVPSLFELKEWERNGKADTQTLITPKGRETFRLLLQRAAS